jgi:lipopolysaccharide biosynthesis glycosyltransferase
LHGSLEAGAQLAIAERAGVEIHPIPGDVTERLDQAIPRGFFTTHVNRSALFRFFVATLAGDQYEKILYLDGDIQVRESLRELLHLKLPAGRVAVVRDWLALHRRPGMSMPAASGEYLDHLGLSAAEQLGYFNSGVMLASPATWTEIGEAALEFLRAHPDRCRFHDQSALNYVCRERLLHVPLRWNFLRQYMALPAYRAVRPAVVHFVGRLKPWDGTFRPWSRREFQPYADMARTLEGLPVRWPRKPFSERLAYHLRPLAARDEYADRQYRNAVNRLVLGEAGVALPLDEAAGAMPLQMVLRT